MKDESLIENESSNGFLAAVISNESKNVKQLCFLIIEEISKKIEDSVILKASSSKLTGYVSKSHELVAPGSFKQDKAPEFFYNLACISKTLALTVKNSRDPVLCKTPEGSRFLKTVGDSILELGRLGGSIITPTNMIRRILLEVLGQPLAKVQINEKIAENIKLDIEEGLKENIRDPLSAYIRGTAPVNSLELKLSQDIA